MQKANYVNTDHILDRFHSNYDFEDSIINKAPMIEWIGNCLLKLPEAYILITKVTDCNSENDPCIVIENFKGLLPCDFITLVGVRDADSEEQLKLSTDMFLLTKNPYYNEGLGKEYTIQNNYIYTNFEEGNLNLTYKALPLDANKKPLIPDSEDVIDCVVKFLARQIAFKLWNLNLLSPDKFQFMSGEFEMALRRAKNSLKTPSVDMMYNIANERNRIAMTTYQGDYGRRYTGFKSR